MDVKLGRIEFEWPLDDVPESLGGSAEAVGRRVVTGEPVARGQTLKLPVRVSADFEGGERIRRQARSLLNNEEARKFLYLAFEHDPELNGWLAVGGGDLTDQAGGSTFGEWELELRDAYRLGNLRTHFEARRFEAFDRRLTTTPRDVLKRLYSDDFAAQVSSNLQPNHYLPYGGEDVIGTWGTWVGSNNPGDSHNGGHGDVYSFVLPDSRFGWDDVVIFDTRGNDAPAMDAEGDEHSQRDYGWEEVYGPDHPLLGQPVLYNHYCRAWWKDLGAGQFGWYVEYNSAFQTGFPASSTVNFLGTSGDSDIATVTAMKGGVEHNAAFWRVVEWTPERCVIAQWFDDRKMVLYTTLQRGWSGPRFELYEHTGQPDVTLRVRMALAGAADLGRSDGNTIPIVSGTNYGNFTARENWGFIRRQGGAGMATLYFGLVQEDVSITGRTGNSGVDFIAPLTATPYVSINLATGATGGIGAAPPIAESEGSAHLYDSRNLPTLVSV